MKKPYNLKLSFNTQTFQCDTADLKASILKFKPIELLTEMYITIKKGTGEFEQRLNKVQGKKLFNDPEFLDLYLNKIML